MDIKIAKFTSRGRHLATSSYSNAQPMAITVDSSDLDKILIGTDKSDEIGTADTNDHAKKTFYIDGRAGGDMLYLDRSLGGAVLGGNGNDVIYASNSGSAQILGEAGKDKIGAYLNKESVFAYGGDDNDDVFGSDKGDDTLYGDKGNDDVKGYNGADTLYGGAGKDKLEGGNGDDYIYGQDGKDKLIGGKGNDYMKAGAGKDKVTGGKGTDTFELSAGQDVITDYNLGKKEGIVVNKNLFGTNLKITQKGSDVRILGDGGLSAILKDVNLVDFLAADVVDFI